MDLWMNEENTKSITEVKYKWAPEHSQNEFLSTFFFTSLNQDLKFQLIL